MKPHNIDNPFAEPLTNEDCRVDACAFRINSIPYHRTKEAFAKCPDLCWDSMVLAREWEGKCRWIRVEDKLPTNGQDVWVIQDGYVELSKYLDSSFLDASATGDDYPLYFFRVTHWQEIIKPQGL